MRVRLSVFTAFLLVACAFTASAQNVFRVRIDTTTVKAGDTATLNVYYTFASSKPHNLNGFVARFLFDSNLVKIVGYSTAGTASDGMPTTQSHLGIAALGSQEIDLKNPILFRMRVAASKTLADTAWLRWDLDWPMFATESGVDSVIQTDGWIRTAVATGHTTLTAPYRAVSGVITGPYADSVKFELPVIISDISSANVTSARLQFAFDHNRLAFEGATTTSKSATISSFSSTQDTATIVFQGVNGLNLLGGDTLVNLRFYALVGADTVCTRLTGAVWQPLNVDAKLGATDVSFDSICIFGRYQPAFVEQLSKRESLRLYPNPATTHVAFPEEGIKQAVLYDLLGRCVARLMNSGDVWTIPASLEAGSYQLITYGSTGIKAVGAFVLQR